MKLDVVINKITTIMQIENTEIYHVLMEKLSIKP